MFQDYSRRALQVIFATRIKAGLRGADSLDVGDLLSAFVIEDQFMFGELSSQLYPIDGVISGPEAHEPFLSPDVASRVLANLESTLSHSTPVPLAQDMPITPELKSVFDYAEALRSESNRRELAPLHLLAAIIKEGSTSLTSELEKGGITYECVVESLRAWR
jgi:hypothetical protein